ncbi:hypothetical protein NSE01_27510 [Novosphingobium sediminis]|uniref:Uncharacterized protein n=1 Tax=Novosphingobium sediminis TaxID=707214 RepID=A0A512AMI2_9SPHN|nr:hypothetical protein NSE01_27510 [Novosphingobium sediminis]
MLEIGPAVEADAAKAEHGEFDSEDIALLAVRIVPRRAVHGGDAAVREGASVERGGFLCRAFVPQTEDGVRHPFAALIRSRSTALADWYPARVRMRSA